MASIIGGWAHHTATKDCAQPGRADEGRTAHDFVTHVIALRDEQAAHKVQGGRQAVLAEAHTRHQWEQADAELANR